MESMTSKNFEVYQVGQEKDGKIIDQIFTATDKYILYREKGNYKLSFDCVSELESLETHISMEYGRLQMNLKNRDRRKYLPTIALAYSQCFEGNQEGAKSILSNLSDKLSKKRFLDAKLLYMISIILLLLINIIITFILKLNKVFFTTLFAFDVPEIFLLATLGSIGGFISVSISLKDMYIDPDASFIYHLTTSGLRILVSMAGAVVIYVLIKSDVLFGMMGNPDHIYGIYFLATLAGFSEKLLPNVFHKAEIQLLNNMDQTIKPEPTREVNRKGY